jgi:hypothetical protein
MDVPSQCTIVRTMSRPAYSSKLNTQKKGSNCILCLQRKLSKSLYIVRKIKLYP